MKKTFTLILLALLAFAPMAWAQMNVSDETALRTALNNSSQQYQNLKLTDDINLQEGELVINYGPTIDLNGHYISGAYGGRIFNVSQNAELVITGGTLKYGRADNGGAIYNQGSLVIENVTITQCTATNQGGAIYSTGSITIYSGSISDNTAANGGAIHLEGGSLTMTDGSITGNSATGNCGGLNITNGAVVTMSGGSIAENTAGNNDGGVYLGGGSNSFTLTGGSITNNIATNASRGGGISVNGGQFYMSGNPEVLGNTAGGNNNNVYLSENTTINVNGAFTEGADVYVTTYNNATGAFTSGYATNNSSTNPNTVFHADNSGFSVVLLNDEASLLEGTWPKTWDSHDATCTLDADGTFTVSGYGSMEDYYDMPGQSNTSPWNAYLNSIKRVVIEDGITNVGSTAFIGCEHLESIELGSSVRFISAYAFKNCHSLETLDIPNNVLSIGPGAFQSCSGLNTITIGTGVSTIDDYAFDGCTNVEDIYMKSLTPVNITWKASANAFKPNGGTQCHVYAHRYKYYHNMFKAVNVTFVGDLFPCEYWSDGVKCTYTDDHTFNLISGAIMHRYDSAEEVPWYQDSISSQFTNLVIGNSVQRIGDYSFYGCTSLTTLTIPANVQFIWNHAFDGCTGITDVYCYPQANNLSWFEPSESFKADGTTVFHVNGGQLLAYLNKFPTANVIFEGDESMGYPFAWVSGDCVVSIASADATELKVNKINNTNGNMANYDESTPAPWAAYANQITTLTLGNGVTSIGNHAFDGFTNLATVNISSNLVTIGQYAFRNCSSLTSFNIPGSVTTIGAGAFHGCIGMTDVYCRPLAENLTWDDAASMPGHVDENLFMPDFATKLHVLADQYDAYENKFRTEHYYSNGYRSRLNVTYVSDLGGFPYVWDQTNVTCTLYESGTFIIQAKEGTSGAMDDPELLQDSYIDPNTGETVTNTYYDKPAWYSFRNHIETVTVLPGVTTISKKAFESSAISSFSSMYSQLTLIDSDAFAGCDQLTTIDIPTSVTTIGEGAFAGSGITSIAIPASVTAINNHTFDGCNALATVSLPNTVTTIGDDAFRYCNFTSITLPSSLTTLGDRAFYGSALTSITLPGTVTTMGNSIFRNCESLTSVTFEDGITAIGESMFERTTITVGGYTFISALTDVNLPNSLTTIGKRAFFGCNLLETITIPANVTMIDDNAFDGCTVMTDVYCNPDPDNLTWNNGAYSFKEDQSTKIHVLQAYWSEYQNIFGYNADNATGIRGTFVTDDYIFETEGNWNTAANWSSGTVPPAGSNVVINANVTVPSGYTADADNIGIMGNNTLTIADGGQLKHTNAVHGTIQKSITGYGDTNNPGGWYLIGAPMIMDSELAVRSGMVDLVEGQIDFNTHTIDLYEFNQDNEDEWTNMRNDLEAMGGNAHLAYLYARANDATLNFSTEEGEAFIPTSKDTLLLAFRSLTYSPEPEFIGWNLIRNPYTCNAYLASGRDFYRMNANGDAIVLATEENGGKAIKPCEGFFVVVGEYDSEQQYAHPIMGYTRTAQIQMTTTEPQSNGTKGMMDIKVKQEGKVSDVARVHFGEGDRTGKLVLDENATRLSIRQDGKDYSVVHNEAQGEMPISFKAKRNGQYTLSVDPEGIEMDYLHLIDNLTGAEVDLLQTPSYTFDSKVTDYESRFKLVFEGKEDNDNNLDNNDNFAFISNGELIVNGEGTLQVVDVNGRILSSETVNGSVSKAINAVPGVYVLRLINGDEVKTQKIVVR